MNEELEVTTYLLGDEVNTALRDAKWIASIGRTAGGGRTNGNKPKVSISPPLNVASGWETLQETSQLLLRQQGIQRKETLLQWEDVLSQVGLTLPSTSSTQVSDSVAYEIGSNAGNCLITHVDVCKELKSERDAPWEIYDSEVEEIISTAHSKVANFRGSDFRDCLREWETITINKEILYMVEGMRLAFFFLQHQFKLEFQSRLISRQRKQDSLVRKLLNWPRKPSLPHANMNPESSSQMFSFEQRKTERLE
jgi:hypothetical protein